MSEGKPVSLGTERMRVILLGPYPPPYGGISTVVEQLAKLLRRDGREVAVITGSRPEGSNEDWVYSFRGRSLRPSTNKWGFVKRFRPNIINFHTNRWNWTNSLVAGFIGVPLVVTIHGEMAPDAYKALNPVRRYLARRSLQMASYVIAVSEPLFNFARDLGVSDQKLCLIPPLFPLDADMQNGVTLSPDTADRFSQSCIRIVTSGFYQEVYGFHLVPEVACNLRDKGIEFAWFLVGHGTEEQMTPLRDAIRTRGLEERVILLGELERPELMRLLRQSHIYVRTKYSDSFGIVIAEAHQMGCFCLVGDNNAYFREERRVMIYKTGDAAALTERLFEAIGQIEIHKPKETESRFAQVGRSNYEAIKKIYGEVEANRKKMFGRPART